MEICLQGRCGLSRFVESQKSLYSCIDWGMSTHIRDAYTFATVVLLLVNTTFCLESISECFVSSFFSFRTFGFVCFFTQTAVQDQTYFLCLFFLVLAFSFMFCLTGWLSDLSESGAGLSGSAWIFLGWWRSPGAGVLSGGRCDNWWDLLLTDDFVREGTRERERPTSVFWHLQYISIFILKVLASRHNKKQKSWAAPILRKLLWQDSGKMCLHFTKIYHFTKIFFWASVYLPKRIFFVPFSSIPLVDSLYLHFIHLAVIAGGLPSVID